MTAVAEPVGICDDCGRLVLTEVPIEIEVPPWLTELEAVAYAIKVASAQLAAPRCRTCRQIKVDLGPCLCICSGCRAGAHCDRASCAQ